MLTNIITNPIDTPYGYKNPVHGIALRGPLSQFFSGIYLKPLDDAFDNTMVTYIRFQDDLLILCKTKRQMQRAKRRMMEVLHERRLTLSRKKSRMGTIESGFHFLGVQYSLTQMENNTRVKHANDDVITAVSSAHSLSESGGVEPIVRHQQHVALHMTPHPRALRKARENVKFMVADQVSPVKIRCYFSRWLQWWVTTSNTWQYHELLQAFMNVCWHESVSAYAIALYHPRPTTLRIDTAFSACDIVTA